jgi:hypothetical protein
MKQSHIEESGVNDMRNRDDGKGPRVLTLTSVLANLSKAEADLLRLLAPAEHLAVWITSDGNGGSFYWTETETAAEMLHECSQSPIVTFVADDNSATLLRFGCDPAKFPYAFAEMFRRSR